MTGGPERLVVLLGYPLGHSLSPAIHNAAFRSQGLGFTYQLLPVPPHDLAATVETLKQRGFAGANVTVPHKETIVDHLDAASEVVRAVGAANTLVWRESATGEELLGDNTDVAGFLATLPEAAIAGRPCVVLGSGGSARAVAYALLSTAATGVTIAARRLNRARTLVESLRSVDPDQKLKPELLSNARDFVRQAGLVVNATPAGMHPETDDTPWATPEDFRSGQLVYDLIYNPSETRLLREARMQEADTMSGLEMLLQQAALSYRLWTGTDMDMEAARAAAIP